MGVGGGGGGGGGGGITTRYHECENVVRFKTFFELLSFYNSNSETSCAIKVAHSSWFTKGQNKSFSFDAPN